MLPKYFYTDVTKESVEWFNKTYNTNLKSPGTYKYIGFDGNTYGGGTDECNYSEDFKNNPIYLTPEQFMAEINSTEFPFTEGEEVYVSSYSVEDALKYKEKSIYLTTIKNAIYPYICVGGGDEEKYIKGEKFNICDWEFIAKIPKEEPIEMTMEEVEKAIGNKIKIIA